MRINDITIAISRGRGRTPKEFNKNNPGPRDATQNKQEPVWRDF